MINRLLASLTMLALTFALPLYALPTERGFMPYSDTLRQQLVESNRGYLLEFSADWCPTCKYQRQLISKLLAEPEFATSLVVEADYDTADSLKEEFKIRRQGTIIALQGGREITREVLARDEDALRALLRAANGQR